MFLLYVTPLDFSQQAKRLIVCTGRCARQSPIFSFGLFDLLTFQGQRGSGALEMLVKPPAVPAHLSPAFALKVWTSDL